MPPVAAPRSPLDPRDLTADDLTPLVSDLLERPVAPESWSVRDVDFSPTAVSTATLHRITGTASAGPDRFYWSIFVKVLQSPRHWSGIDLVPAPIRQLFVDTFPWRVEADVLTSEVPRLLPAGLRTPRVFAVHDLGDDRTAMWLEDIAVADVRWDLRRYAAAARLLGRLAGSRSGGAIPHELRPQTGAALRMMAAGRLTYVAWPQLYDDALWTLPPLASAAQLRHDLRTLAARVPALLDRLDTLPQAVGHGDACPQNLLIPADAPDTFVAIDFGWQCPHAVGYDLGQLLVGHVHTGELAVARLPHMLDPIVSAYTAGLQDRGCAATRAEVAYGCAASMIIRSAFTSLPTGQPDDPDPAQALALTRYLVEVGLGLPIR